MLFESIGLDEVIKEKNGKALSSEELAIPHRWREEEEKQKGN